MLIKDYCDQIYSDLRDNQDALQRCVEQMIKGRTVNVQRPNGTVWCDVKVERVLSGDESGKFTGITSKGKKLTFHYREVIKIQ